MPSLSLPFTAGSAPTARHHVVAQLRTAGLPVHALDDAGMVLAELVGNAVRHGAALPDGLLEVGWQMYTHAVLLSVVDGGGGAPVLRHAGSGDVGGRGLAIVAALAQEWGVRHPDQAHTEVWARLAV